jgi:hypothetical protein
MTDETKTTHTTIIHHAHQLGDIVTTPAGSGIVTRIILELGGATIYSVKAWIGEPGEVQPVEIEVYQEELQ